MKKTLFPRIPLVLGVGLALLALLASFAPPAGSVLAQDDPEVCVRKDLGTRVNLTVGSKTYRNQWLGQFHLTVDGEPYDGWCIDLEHGIRSGQCFPAALTDASRETPWCEIGYIMTNYSPGSNDEAAAIQLALWKCKYGKDYVRVSHSGIESMATAIYTDAQGECPRVIAGYSELTLQAVGDLVVGGGRACQKFTATVTDPGVIPLQGIQIQFETPNGSFSPPSGGSLTVPTDGNGEASVTVCWDASQGSFQGSLTAYTEGYWPVIIYPTGSIQETIILQHRELTAEDHVAWQQELGSLEVTKEANTDISKVGDTITYTIEVCNTGDVALTKTSIIDTLLGDISDDFADTLAAGACESHNFNYVVQSGDPDTLVNEVTATYEDLAGNAVSDVASDEVDLVHPGLKVTKTADPTSGAVGDTITYTIKVENTGDVDLILDSVEDTLLGSLTGFASTLGVGASETETYTRNIQLGDLDPLVNEVEFHYDINGLPNDITDKDDASVDLVSPGLKVSKVADTDISKVGDTITYTIKVCNISDVALTKTSIIDTLLGDISDDFADTLASGACESHNFNYVVQSGDPDTLVNEVTATYEDLAGHVLSDVASDEVVLVHPDIEVTKTANPTSGAVGDTITYTITVTNTGDVELENITVTDSLLGDLSASFADSLVSGASDTQTFPRIIGDTDPDPLVNTVTVHANPISLTNDIADEDYAEVEVTELHDLQIEKRDSRLPHDIIDREGLAVKIEPNPFTGTAGSSLTVTDNDDFFPYDKDPALGIILLKDILQNNIPPCYTITEIAAPDGYLLDSTPHGPVCVGSKVTFILYNTPEVGSIKILKLGLPECGPCDGKVSFLRLQYNGAKANIEVKHEDGTTLFTGEVETGGQFEFSCEGLGGELKNKITIWVNGEKVTFSVGKEEDGIHTSCSDPYVKPGGVFGAFQIVYLESSLGGPMCPLQPPYDEGVVIDLPGAKFKIEPNPYDGAELTVVDNYVDPTYAYDMHTTGYGIILLENIPPGSYTITEIVAPEGYVLDSTPQEIEVFTGETAVFKFTNPPCGPCDGRVSFLRLQYNGTVTASIVVKAKNGDVLYSHDVNPGGQFEFNCFQFSGRDSGKLGTEINIYVDGEPPTNIHTSCSQPIDTGMDFGAFKVIYGESLYGGPFCPIVQGGATITGYKFRSDDCTDDTLFALNGWGIELWKINLSDLSETKVDTVYTDATGEFTFEDVAAGIYKVVEEERTGWEQCDNSPLRTYYWVIVTEEQADAGDSITSDVYGDALQFFNSAV